MIELVSYKDIKPNPKNPRTWTRKDLVKAILSLQEFPQMLWVRPSVVNAEGVVNGGNMRRAAIKDILDLSGAVRRHLYDENIKKCNEQGKELARLFFLEKKIPIYRATEFTVEQEAEFIIKDNGSFGDWDMDLLANEWSDLPLDDWGVKGLEFTKDEDEPKKSKPRKPYLKIEFESDDDLGNCRGLVQDLIDKQGFDAILSVSLEVF